MRVGPTLEGAREHAPRSCGGQLEERVPSGISHPPEVRQQASRKAQVAERLRGKSHRDWSQLHMGALSCSEQDEMKEETSPHEDALGFIKAMSGCASEAQLPQLHGQSLLRVCKAQPEGPWS